LFTLKIFVESLEYLTNNVTDYIMFMYNVETPKKKNWNFHINYFYRIIKFEPHYTIAKYIYINYLNMFKYIT